MLIRNQDVPPAGLIGAAEQPSVGSPLFPLSHIEAVNPFIGLSDAPIALVAARRRRKHIFPNRSVQLGRIAKGSILMIFVYRGLKSLPTELSEQAILGTAHSANDILRPFLPLQTSLQNTVEPIGQILSPSG
jgi:hypothetical protein